MNCPGCGTENEDTSKTCRSCGRTLERTTVRKPRVSKLAIISLILGILSLPLSLFLGIPTIICSVISLRKISKSDELLKGKGLAIAGLVLSLVSTFVILPLFFIWCMDAPPIPIDYTLADLRSAPPEYAESYQLLKSLVKETLEDPLEPKDPNTREREKNSETLRKGNLEEIRQLILLHSERINQAWNNAQKSRDIIKQLNSFPEIADLTIPSIDTSYAYLRNLRSISEIFQYYTFLQTELVNDKDAVENLIEIDSVFRKLSINARGLVPKLVCYAILQKDIETANYILNNPQTNKSSLLILEKHFKPLTDEQISLRNSFINEYLMFKNTLDTTLKDVIKRKNPIIKRNSALRVFRNMCDKFIICDSNGICNQNNRLWVWPTFYPRELPNVDILNPWECWQYKYYNPIGSLLVGVMTPALGKCVELKDRTITENKLFQIILNQRLGRKISPELQTFKEQHSFFDIDNKKILHPGRDGKKGTEDDVTLPINPELLNLIKTN